MIIKLNGENIDYTLEEERNLGEAVGCVSSWLREYNMLLSTITIDGRKVAVDDVSWHLEEIKNTRELDIITLSLEEALYTQLDTGREFFHVLSQTAQKGDIDGLKIFATSWEDIKKHITELLRDDHENVKELFCGIEESGFPLSPEPDMTRLFHFSSSLTQVLDGRCSEIERANEITLKIARELAHYAGNLDEVGVQFQTGRDKEAMNTIVHLIEKLQILIRCLRFTSIRTTSLNDKLNVVLGELETALQASDTVQTGDLLEYEIKPMLISLPTEINPGN